MIFSSLSYPQKKDAYHLENGSKGFIIFLFKDAMYLLLNKAYISKFVHMCVYLKTPLTKGKE